MNKILKIFLAGLIISFLGSLPLGTLNITAFRIAASQNTTEAFMFSIAAILVELIIVRITLLGSHKINLNSKLFLYLLPFTIVLFIYLAVSNFNSSGSHVSSVSNNIFTPIIKSSFLLGLTLSLLNPMHIPFWMGWNSILITKNTLERSRGMYLFYITGIGLGSISALLIFIFAGSLIFQRFQQFSFLITIFMGFFYLGFAAFILYKFSRNYLRLSILSSVENFTFQKRRSNELFKIKDS